MKRFVSLIAIVAVAGAAALIVARHAIPIDTISEAVKTEIGAATGLDPDLRGPVSMSVFPARMVSFSDVVLGDAAAKEPAVAVEQMIVNLRLMPLLAGTHRDRRHHADQAAHHRRRRRGRAYQLVAARRYAGARAAAGHQTRRAVAVVLRNSDQRRHHRHPRSRARRHRDARGGRDVARLAVDRQELRRHRPFQLAQGDGRREHRDVGFSRRSIRPELRSEIPVERRPAERGVRRQP